MTPYLEKSRLLAWLSLVLVAGFLVTSIAAYVVSRDSIRQGIVEQALPLTGDNIYSEIQKDILRPVFISSLMAHDTFLRDWMLNGERDGSQIVRYLNEVKQKYGTITSFLVSERSRRYYYAGGTLKSVREGDPRDLWFFRVRGMQAAYETNVDPDMANRDTMTIFINYRVLDYQGNFLGATGVGLTLDTVARLIESYEERFRRRIYFVDAQGAIVLAGKSMQGVAGSIRDLSGIRDIAGAILNRSNTPTRLEYRRDGAAVLVNSRFLPELDWYLVVEQGDNDEVKPLQQVLALNLAVSAAVTLLVLAITLFAVKRYQGRLEQMAGTDALTGLLNRQAFNLILQQSMLEVRRSGRPLSAILFDIDLFKQVNDSLGHLAGDQVIRSVAELAKRVLRESDAISRWGGEEFLVLLRDCPLEEARTVAEKLRQAIARHEFGLDPAQSPITISLGVAQGAADESADGLFARADQALYRAKDNGRNRIEIAPAPPGQDTAA